MVAKHIDCFRSLSRSSMNWLSIGYSLDSMSNSGRISILFLGDIIGKPGRDLVVKYVTESLASANPPDIVIANVENAAHGFGVTSKALKELLSAGVRVFSGGNHSFDKKEIFEIMDRYPTLLRPANYPPGTPGRGTCVVDVNGFRLGVINLLGRVFMEPLESPFLAADRLLSEFENECDAILVDLHAEATAEKVALGLYLDGRVCAVVGTHTHVQTADERILPGGTAYITDAGCCGPCEGVIGMDKEGVFRRMVQQLPTRFEIAKGRAELNGVRIEIDKSTARATSINRICVKGESRDRFDED